MIGWKIGANFLSQSCRVANAKPITFRHSNENRSNICIDHGDLYDCSDSDSDDSDPEDDYAGPLQEGGTEMREALKNFVWDNLY